jgi:hypothetical protein
MSSSNYDPDHYTRKTRRLPDRDYASKSALKAQGHVARYVVNPHRMADQMTSWHVERCSEPT